jgi:hypothetical protein
VWGDDADWVIMMMSADDVDECGSREWYRLYSFVWWTTLWYVSYLMLPCHICFW